MVEIHQKLDDQYITVKEKYFDKEVKMILNNLNNASWLIESMLKNHADDSGLLKSLKTMIGKFEGTIDWGEND